MKFSMSARIAVLTALAYAALMTAHTVMAKTSAECGGDVPGNTNPPAFVAIKIFRMTDEKRQPVNTFPSVIPVGYRVTLDATPKDASRQHTQASGEGIKWIFTGTDGSYSVTGDDCFTPAIRVLGPGFLHVSATADGAPSEPRVLTINFGTDYTVEDDTFCAFHDDKGYHCITGTQDDPECDDPETVERCGLAPCERKSLDDDCVGGGPAVSNPVLTPQANPEDLGELVGLVFSWSLSIIGIVVFVMLLFSGFMWLTAAGNPGQISQAKGRMVNALLGAALLLSAYLILSVINPNLVKQASTLPSLPGTTGNK